jgi:putative membrane protein
MAQQQRGWWLVLGVLVLIVFGVPLLGGGMLGWGMMGPGMMGGWGGQGGPFAGGWGWAMALSGLAMLAFWGAVIVGIVLAVRALSGAGSASPAPRGDSALDILKRRYAAGELTREQYEEMRRMLEQ